MFSNFQSRFSANCSMLFWEKGDNFCGFQSLSHWIWSLLPLLQTACPQMPYSVGSGAECRMGNNWTEHDALSTQVERVVFDVFPALGLVGRRDPSPFGPKCLSPLTRKFYFWTCVCPSSSHVIALRSSPILTCFGLWAAFTSFGSFFFFTYNHTWSYQDFSMGPIKPWPFVSEPGSLRPLPLLPSLTVISVPVTQPRDFTPLSPPENQSFPQHSGPTVQALFQLTWHSPFVFLDETWPYLLWSSSAVLVLLCTLISVDTVIHTLTLQAFI